MDTARAATWIWSDHLLTKAEPIGQGRHRDKYCDVTDVRKQTVVTVQVLQGAHGSKQVEFGDQRVAKEPVFDTRGNIC